MDKDKSTEASASRIPEPVELKGPGAVDAKAATAAAAAITGPAADETGPAKVPITRTPIKPGTMPVPTGAKTKIHSWREIRNDARTRSLIAAGIFAMILIGAGFIYYIQSEQASKKTAGNKDVVQENFNPNFDQAAGNQIKVGDKDHVLTVQGLSFFKDKVAVDNGLSVNGPVTVTGQQTASTLSVTGQADLASANVKSNLVVAGSTDLQGAVTFKSLLTAANGLNVVGNSSFSGDLVVGNFTANGANFNGVTHINNHLVIGGGTPGISAGGGAGSAGTASISGSDTAGTVTIGVGVGGGAGSLANISFRSSYGSTPRVIISPASSQSAILQYYVSRSSGGFAINSASAPAPGSYVFDYMVVQ